MVLIRPKILRSVTLSLIGPVAFFCVSFTRHQSLPRSVPRQPPKNLVELLAASPAELAQSDIATASLLCADGLPGTEHANGADEIDTLDKWANRIQSETYRNLYRYRTNPKKVSVN
jgi:hypothetical protein